MPVSDAELHEQARLLDEELTRQTALCDSIDTRAGVAIGFAGVLAGLIAVANRDAMLHRAVILALASAFIGLLAGFPRRTQSPDPEIVADLYERLPEAQATAILSRTRLRAVRANTSITESKRLLLTLSVIVLVVAVVFATLGAMAKGG